MFLSGGVGQDSRVPWTVRKSNQSVLKEISPEYSLKGLMLKLKCQYFCNQATDVKDYMRPKFWSFSFSISTSNEYAGLISFRMDWLDLLAVQGTLKSPPTPQFKNINSSVLSFLYSPTLTSIHDH